MKLLAIGTVCALLVGCVDYHERQVVGELAELRDSPVESPVWAKEWAGSYSMRNGPGGENIKVAPKSGIVHFHAGCFDSEFSYGDIAGGDAEGLSVRWRYHGLSDTRYYFIRWGERRYIASEGEMIMVVNDYNEKLICSGKPAFLIWMCCRDEDLEKPEGGRLDLPEPWGSMLREEPLHATVLGVQRRPAKLMFGESGYQATAKLKGGRKDGLYVGLNLYDISPGAWDLLTVTKVGEDSSEATTNQYIKEGRPRFVEVGDELCNRPHERSKESASR
jgi:hypothetical protein